MAHNCIFCGRNGPFSTREHILPESLGGDESFVMKRGAVCDKCQNYFGAKIEAVSLNNYPFSHWCTFSGMPTKKGKIPFFNDIEGTFFGLDDSGIMSVACHPFLHKALMEGRKSQLRLLAEPRDQTCVCRFLLKMGIELVHEDGIADVYDNCFLAAKQFARFCNPGSQWWFILLELEEGPSHLTISDIGNRDLMFSISNGYTYLFVPLTGNIIADHNLNIEGGRVRIYTCRA